MVALRKRLVRMIGQTKGQFIAVTVVLTIGLLSYVALNMTIQNLDNTVKAYYDQTQMPQIFAQVLRIPEGKVEALKSVSGVQAVNARIVEDVKFDTGYGGEKTVLRLVSLPDATTEKPLSDIYLLSGNRPSQDNEVAVIHLFAKARNLKVEDTFDIIVGGRKKALKITGIVSNPEYIYLVEDEQSLLPDPRTFGVAYVTSQFAQSQLGYQKSYNSLLITTNSGADQDAVIDELDRKLDKYGVMRIYKREDHISSRMIQEEITQGQKTANTVPVLFLSVAGAIIAVMLGRIVKNDRISIGVFKALGYTNGAIVWHYTQYALGIGIVGSTLGMLLGAMLANSLAKLYTTTVYDIPILVGRLYPEYLILAVLIGSIFCIASGIIGARGVLTIQPAESMRPEVPKTGRRILLERIKPVWRRLSFTWKVVIRNIFRSKKRAIFIALGIALTYAVTLLPFFMLSAFMTMFDQQYGQMYAMDMQVTYTHGLNQNSILDLKQVLGDHAQEVEPIAEFPFELSAGWRKKNVSIIGIVENTRMYNFTNRHGQPVKLPREGISITEGLARLLEVEVGDSINIKSFIPGRESVVLSVNEIVEQPLGVNAYMDLEHMQRVLLDHDYINGAVIRGERLESSELDHVKHIKSVLLSADMMAIFKEFTALTYASILVMVASAGILGFAIVYNATIMSIYERKMEFSSLRVLGFDKQHIFKMLFRENLVLSALGIIIGIPLGASMVDSIMASFSNELYTMKADFDFMAFVYTTVVTIAFVLIAQVATHHKIAKLDFIEALKARIS